MKWLEMIKKSKNINQLPTYKELLEIAENEGIDLYEEWSNGVEVIIADGTIVRLEAGNRCFNSKDEWCFYVVEDIYICAECGLMQKSYDEIKEEIGYIDDIFIKLLPVNWNINGVKSYLKSGVIRQQLLNERENSYYRVNRNRFNFFRDCSTCIHMKNYECIFGNDDYNEDCEDYEAR